MKNFATYVFTYSINYMNQYDSSISAQNIQQIQHYCLIKNQTIKIITCCMVKVGIEGRRKMKEAVFTLETIYLFKSGKLRYQLPFMAILKVQLAMHSSEILILSEKEGWIIDSFEERSRIISILQHKTSLNVAIQPKNCTLMDGQLKGFMKNFKSKEKEKKRDKEILNLRKLKKEREKDKNEEIGTNEQILNKYEIMAPLLSSEYWQTYIAREKQKNLNVTMKVFKKSVIRQHKQMLFYIVNEGENLKNILSPYVPKIHRFFHTPSHVFIVVDFHEGLFLSELQKTDLMKVETIKYLIAQIAMGIGHLHECGIVYGDLGLHSVLINHDGHILLINIGLSLEKGQKIPVPLRDCSPECLEKSVAVESLDWWRLGHLTYQLLEGRHLFETLKEDEIKKQLKSNKKLEIEYKNTPEQLRELVDNLLMKKVEKRAGHKNDYHEVLSYSFFSTIKKKQLVVKETPMIKKMVMKKVKKGQVNLQGEKVEEFNQFLNKYTYSRYLQQY